jgi:hypothetical protein
MGEPHAHMSTACAYGRVNGINFRFIAELQSTCSKIPAHTNISGCDSTPTQSKRSKRWKKNAAERHDRTTRQNDTTGRRDGFRNERMT